MNFYVDGKKERYDAFSIKRNKKIGEGKEVVAYQIDSQAVKIYKSSWFMRFSKEEIDRLRNINPERILLPKHAILSKRRNVAGYKMQYIEDLGEDSFLDLSKEDLRSEMQYLKKDVELLSDHGVILDDLHRLNSVYHHGIYLIDPGRYRFVKRGNLEEKDKIQCYGMNIDRINEYLPSMLSRFALVRSHIESAFFESNKENMMDYLSEINENTLREYVDSMGKRRR